MPGPPPQPPNWPPIFILAPTLFSNSSQRDSFTMDHFLPLLRTLPRLPRKCRFLTIACKAVRGLPLALSLPSFSVTPSFAHCTAVTQASWLGLKQPLNILSLTCLHLLLCGPGMRSTYMCGSFAPFSALPRCHLFRVSGFGPLPIVSSVLTSPYPALFIFIETSTPDMEFLQ